MPFIILVASMALFVAGAAAYFSIYGLALIFSGAMIPVVIMASALEVGKLCATSVVYNYWDKLGWLMRTYLVSAILILMLITSGGIYGFLSAAYQKDQLPLEQINAKIELLNSEYKRKTARLKQMDDTVAAIAANYISKRLEEKAQQKDERDKLDIRINEIESEKLSITTRKLETEAHIGPIIYMAKVFGKTTDEATNWLIMLFIFVFDPLAVALTIIANMLVRLRAERLKSDESEEQEVALIDPPHTPNESEWVKEANTDKPLSKLPGVVLTGSDEDVNLSNINIEILNDPEPEHNDEMEAVTASIKQLQDVVQSIKDNAPVAPTLSQLDQEKITKAGRRSELINQIRSNTLE